MDLKIVGNYLIMSTKYYATAIMGLERIAADEIKELGGRVKEIREGKGRIFFEGNFELIPKLNFFRANH
jgi:tRNA (guanine6-N2)-methyltransferase